MAIGSLIKFCMSASQSLSDKNSCREAVAGGLYAGAGSSCVAIRMSGKNGVVA